MDDIRLDKYLWAVRVFKTRSDAADAVRNNKVTVNGAYAKPSREVKIGDVIAVRRMQVTYSYKVLDLVSSRQPAKNVSLYCLNVTPKEELKERSAQAAALVQPLADLTGLRPAMRNRVTRLLALALAGEWIAAGCKDDPGEPGFDERERALALCRRYPADRELVRLRHDILQHIWSFPWFWRTQVVEGRRITAGELKREFSELQTLLERGEP